MLPLAPHGGENQPDDAGIDQNPSAMISDPATLARPHNFTPSGRTRAMYFFLLWFDDFGASVRIQMEYAVRDFFIKFHIGVMSQPVVARIFKELLFQQHVALRINPQNNLVICLPDFLFFGRQIQLGGFYSIDRFPAIHLYAIIALQLIAAGSKTQAQKSFHVRLVLTHVPLCYLIDLLFED